MTLDGMYRILPSGKDVGFEEFFINQNCKVSCYSKEQSEL